MEQGHKAVYMLFIHRAISRHVNTRHNSGHLGEFSKNFQYNLNG